jgi:cation transport ATPase
MMFRDEEKLRVGPGLSMSRRVAIDMIGAVYLHESLVLRSHTGADESQESSYEKVVALTILMHHGSLTDSSTETSSARTQQGFAQLQPEKIDFASRRTTLTGLQTEGRSLRSEGETFTDEDEQGV